MVGRLIQAEDCGESRQRRQWTMSSGRSAVGGRLSRLLTIAAGLVFAALCAVSAVISHSDELLVGATEDGPPPETRVLSELDNSVPDPTWSESGRPGSPVVALTFDDGPDPVRTSDVLDVLSEHGVRGTFFVTGREVLAQPDMLKRIASEGHEIGLHSFNHARMGDLSSTQLLRQYELNQWMVLGTVGVKPVVARAPYSGAGIYHTTKELTAAELAQTEGGLTMIYSDLVARDFEGIPAAQIAAESLPEADRSAIVTLHDGPSDQPRHTAAGLRLLIPELKKRGYEFVTASEYGRVASTAPVPTSERVVATAVTTTAGLLGSLTGVLRLATVVLAPLLLVRALALIILPWRQAMVRRRSRRFRSGAKTPSETPPGVSIIVPAYNEEVGIAGALFSFLRQDYEGPIEIIMVDDGSSDATIARAARFPDVRILSKPNGGKASALNVGFDAASHDFCILVDGDTMFDATAVKRLMEAFDDDTVGAAAGYPMVGNRMANLLTQVQHVEYMVQCSLLRRAQEAVGAVSCMPGPVAAFRKEALDDIGGVPDVTLAEDADLTVALGAAGWKLRYIPDAVAWTEAPIDIRTLWKQRMRWTYGTLQVMWRHRKRSPSAEGERYRRRALALMSLDMIWLPFTPLADLFAILALATGRGGVLVAAVVFTVIIQLVTTWFAAVVDGERRTVLLYAPAQLLFFRYFNLLVLAGAVSSILAGRRQKWHKPKRLGMVPNAAVVPDAAVIPDAAVDGVEAPKTESDVNLEGEPKNRSPVGVGT